jgi:uncharacterized membrane protein YhaH (DUF805 family)
MFGWRLPMGRLRFALFAGLCIIAMPLTSQLTPIFTRLIRWLPNPEAGAALGLVMMVFAVGLFVLALATLLVSTARRLKDIGVTRWLTPLSLVAEWVLWTPRLFDLSTWSDKPVVAAVILTAIVWVSFLVLTPGRAARLGYSAA